MIAKLGQNIQFVAFVAHAFVIAFILSKFTLPHRFILIVPVLIFAALKEFWYDARYESDPPQTWRDNMEDFLGYAVGCVIALL